MSTSNQPVRAYRLASSDTLVNLEKAVNQALAAGWQPYGPPFLTHDHRVVQALVLPAGVKAAPGAAPAPQGISAVVPAQPQQAAQAAQQPVQAQPQPQPHQAAQHPQPAAQAFAAQGQPAGVPAR